MKMNPFPPAYNIKTLDDCIKQIQAIGKARQEDIAELKNQLYVLGRLRTDRTVPTSATITGGDALGDIVRDGDKYYVVVNTGSAYEWRCFDLYSPIFTEYVNVTQVGNVGSGEDNLMTCTLPGGALAADGDNLYIEGIGDFNTTSSLKTLKFYFGSTSATLFTSAASTTEKWQFFGYLYRLSATTQLLSYRFHRSTSLTTSNGAIVFPTETLANDVTIKFTGESTVNDYVIQYSMKVKLNKGA